MSLLSSIFGGTEKEEVEKKKAKTDLFEKPAIAVPERPNRKFTAASIARAPSDAPSTAAADPVKRKREETAITTITKDSIKREAVKEAAVEEEKEEKIKKEDVNELTVFVGNLPVDTTRKTLAKIFKSCGKVTSSRIRSVAVAGVKLPQSQAGNQDLVKKVASNTKNLDTDAKQSVTGYVVFAEKESVQTALAMNNTQIPDKATGKSRRIRVDHAQPTEDSTRSVFVGNLPYSADEASLQAHFVQGCGWQEDETAVEGVRIVRDKETFQCKGFGYVLFRDVSMVSTALRNMHNSTYMKKEMRVMVCGRRPKKAPRKQDEPAAKKQRTFEGRRGPTTGASSVSALKRILTKSNAEASAKKHRPRAEKKPSGKTPSNKAGLSRRAAVDAKVEKRVKKIKKRIEKGMGKARIK